METQILKCLNFDMKHPKPTDFLERFSKAAKLESTERKDWKYTKSHAITLYFIDIAFLDEVLPQTRPSLIAAASIMCTLRVLGRDDWSKQLEHYTTYSRDEVKGLADRLIANGRSSKATALALKYSSKRLGGKGTEVAADGVTLNHGSFHIIKAYFERTASASTQPISDDSQTVHTGHLPSLFAAFLSLFVSALPLPLG